MLVILAASCTAVIQIKNVPSKESLTLEFRSK